MKLKRVMVKLLYRCCGKDLPKGNSIIDDMGMDEIEKLAEGSRYRRSVGKLCSMLQAYEDDGFCSFWGLGLL